MKIASHMDLSSFIVMDVMRDAQALEAQGMDIKHLEVGQPRTPAPAPAIKAIRDALPEIASHGYTLALGMPPLRDAIAALYQRWYGKYIDPARIVVTVGSSLGFEMALLTCFEPGDVIALPCPGYPAYRNLLRVLGLRVFDIPTRADTNWRLNVAHLRALKEKPNGLILASPMNPTGATLNASELKEIAHYCHETGIRLISDEIYHGITFDGPAASAVDLTPSAIVVNSFSKYFSMTGYRIGWMVVPDKLVDPLERLSQNLIISVPTLSQIAALAAMTEEESFNELDGHVARYRANRDILMSHLPKSFLGNVTQPEGAFYLYADTRAISSDSKDLCKRLLHEAHVALTPGIDFDPFEGHLAVRLSFAGSETDMQEACKRINQWVNSEVKT